PGERGGSPRTVIAITDFESQVEGRPGLEALGLVAVDYAYRGKVFRPGDVWFSDALSRSGFEISFPADRMHRKIMILFADRYGNERKETRSVADFRPVSPQSLG
ncbi:MAG: hypothetical protein ACE5LH_10040, partial [Fidelibacterota bacterium]